MLFINVEIDNIDNGRKRTVSTSMNDAACALEITLLPVTQGFAPILLFGVDFERCDGVSSGLNTVIQIYNV